MAEWIKKWGYEISAVRVRPGIWKLKGGGHFVRSKVTVKGEAGRTGVMRALPDCRTPAEAQRVLDDLIAEVKARKSTTETRKPVSFFAASLLSKKVAIKEIESQATIERWSTTLNNILIPAFGHLDVREFRRHHISEWITKTVIPWMVDGKLTKFGKGERGYERVVLIKPTTVNGWLRILQTVCNAMVDEYDLDRNPFRGVDFLPEGRLYTAEQPNALHPEKVSTFLAKWDELYPQHFAMAVLGFATGLRPSSMRPLRRDGPHADINWTTGVLKIRRSHSRKGAVMNKTKTKKDQEIALPTEIMAVLRRHVFLIEQEKGPMAESHLLFPSEDGNMRSRGVLVKPFARVVAKLEWGLELTPRAMRRTFQDLARAAELHDVVTRSISGHATEQMQQHYSTAQRNEQRDGLTKVLALMTGKPAEEKKEGTNG